MGFCHLSTDNLSLYHFQNTTPKPFASVRLSSDPQTELLDFLWNPCQVRMFAAILANGSVSIFEMKENGLNVCASLKEAKASASRFKQLGIVSTYTWWLNVYIFFSLLESQREAACCWSDWRIPRSVQAKFTTCQNCSSANGFQGASCR